MSEVRRDGYRFSPSTVITIGGLLVLASVPLFVIGGALGLIPLLIGLPSLISGLIRESHERRDAWDHRK